MPDVISVVGASKEEKDRPLSKREYDLVIAAGLMEDKTDLENFDDIFVIRMEKKLWKM